MLTISKPLSAGQARRYHAEEFQNARDNYYTEGDRIRGVWYGQLAERWGLAGNVREDQFERLAEGQHPITGEQLVRHQTARETKNARGDTVTTMEHRAGWDATFSAPKSVSLTALVGGDERVRDGTQRITDVRTWFAAGVRELRRADNIEVNYYAASTGKSGGQKAKLAFTILASALSAQYGLSTAPADAPNFRLVVIDEAFSRTDESNSTRAMQLFARLGFQLLIVGPFDAKAKLAVPFVRTIHLASNPSGNSSRLVALTREQVEAAPDDSAPQAGASLPSIAPASSA